MPDNLSYSDVLREMAEIRETWRNNTYTLTEDQQLRYDLLLQVRRLRVSSFYADDRVFTGGMQS